MKKLLLIALLLIAFSSFAQQAVNMPKDSTTSKVAYIEVVEAEGVTAAELYSRAREWVSTSYKSANNVLQMDDKQEGKLIGKAYQDFVVPTAISKVTEQMWYTFKIYVKDNKYRYEITDIYSKGYPTQSNGFKSTEMNVEEFFSKRAYNKKGEMKESFVQYLTPMDSGIKDLIVSLKTAMGKKASLVKDDW